MTSILKWENDLHVNFQNCLKENDLQEKCLPTCFQNRPNFFLPLHICPRQFLSDFFLSTTHWNDDLKKIIEQAWTMIDLSKWAIWACKLQNHNCSNQITRAFKDSSWLTQPILPNYIFACVPLALQKPWSKDFHCSSLFNHFFEIIIPMRGESRILFSLWRNLRWKIHTKLWQTAVLW